MDALRRTDAAGHPAGAARHHVVGACCRPFPGETVCGDVVVSRELDNGRLLLGVIDGLGHGPHARAASLAAAEVLATDGAGTDLVARLAACDLALRSTRGAAIALLEIDFTRPCLRHVGVGNVTTLICSRPKRRLASSPGIVGTGLPPLQVETVALAAQGSLAIFSDGLDPLFDQQYPFTLAGAVTGGALVPEDPGVLARDLVQLWGRQTDDVGLAVLSWGPAP